MGKEFELKYAATQAQLESIAGTYGNFTTISMETTYYDTPTKDLSARRITLRQRLENGLSVCTLKTPATGFGRGEWELEAEDIRTVSEELCKLAKAEELLPLMGSGLIPICGAKFTRRAIYLSSPGVELALDVGILTGGGREEPLCEVEVEQKTATEEETLAFAKTLAQTFGLLPEEKSKFRRALALAEGE